MSLAKLQAGRKRDRMLWDYYTYDATCDRSACLVVDDKDKLELVLLIPSEADVHIWYSGKNTSDQAHLNRGHQDVHESTKKSIKQGVKRTASGKVNPVPKSKLQMYTESECLTVTPWR